MFIAFLSSPLLFLSRFPPGIKNALVTKQTNFAQPTGKSGTVLAKEIAFVIAGQLSSPFPLLRSLSLDCEFQHLLGKIWGFEESRDFLGKSDFLE